MDLNISIDKLQKGSEKELKRLHQLYFPYFLSFACGYIKDQEVCRDLIQDVFISYWEKHQDFSDFISLKAYFYRSIRNKCLNEIRNNKSKYFIELEELHNKTSMDYLEEKVIREEVSKIIHEQIKNLTPQAQKILRLSLQGKTNPEIADILFISVNTVKTHKLKAYSLLRIKLRDLHNLIQIITII